jgi:eukaryotic-like serine/threonine-protein kinase
LKTPFDEIEPEVSPDGRWLAYVSNETGKSEVYVRSASGGADQWQISTGGAGSARWRGDGRELFFATASGKLMSVVIDPGSMFQPSEPRQLFDLPALPRRGSPVFEDATPDGKRFLLSVPTAPSSSVSFRAIANWPSTIRTQ